VLGVLEERLDLVGVGLDLDADRDLRQSHEQQPQVAVVALVMLDDRLYPAPPSSVAACTNSTIARLVAVSRHDGRSAASFIPVSPSRAAACGPARS
jgi:hypothetical protein